MSGLLEHALSVKHPKAKVPSKKVVRTMHVTKSKGGYHVRHEHDNPVHDNLPEEKGGHVVPDTDALHDHIEEHFGEPNPGEAEAEAGSGAAPDEAEV